MTAQHPVPQPIREPTREPTLGASELEQLEALCVALAVAAGSLIRDERPTSVDVADTKSSDTDVVTVMDRAAEDLLHARLRTARPDDGILGEEGADVVSRTGLTWVLDPIDGTVNYLYDIPAYAVSVAVVVGDPRVDGAWRPVAGAVSDPSRRVVHHARRGAGAFTSPEDGAGSPRRLAVSEEHRVGRCLLATGFGYSPEVRARQAEVLLRVLPEVRDIRRIGSAALDLVRVAEGTVDAYAENGVNAWDIAAGWVIVEEAGGALTGVDAHPGKRLTVAAGPALLHPVRDLFLGSSER